MASPARILITGSTGFIGRMLVAAVVARFPAAELRLPVRDRARAERTGLPPSALVETELDDAARLRSALADVDCAVHVAGAVKAVRRAELLRSNVACTEGLVAAAAPRTRIVLLSSLAAAGPSVDGRGTAAAPEACRPCSAYGESKRQGELALLRDAQRTGRPWLVLRPCLVYGPGDGATALLFRQATAPLSFVPCRPRPLSTLHVADVVRAILAALERPDASGAFLPLGGAVTDTHALVRAIAAACGTRARLVGVPGVVAAAAGRAADLVARRRGVAGYFGRDKVREVFAPGWVADGAPAWTALGFGAAVGLGDGLAAVAASLRAGRAGSLA